MSSRLSRREWLLLSAGLASAARADEFFVRNHFSEPRLPLATWKLRVEGRVARPLELTFSDLLEAPSTKLDAVLECAGNGPSGNAVSMGEWQGVSLAQLLRDAGADSSGAVLLEGADEGELREGLPRAAYRRIVPRSKCRAPESIVAFKRDGRFLAQSHGFPARAILPGWYGMDSVKWLRRIVVLNRDENQDRGPLYCRLRNHAPPERVSRILVKSMIAYPADGAKLPAAPCVVRGYAWTGEASIRRVEISVDGGERWAPAQLAGPPRPFVWVEWSYSWRAGPGEHVLLSRAWDSAGDLQPLARDPDRLDSYELNHCAPVRCTVR